MKTKLFTILALSSIMAIASPPLRPDGLAIPEAGPAPAPNHARQMKAFPAAEKGMKRFVAHLPKLKDEQAFRVEIIVGKTVEVDTANRHFFGGRIESENIKGWGYTRYIVRKLGPMAGTLRGSIGGIKKEQRFVKISGEPFLIRYNSRLPVVVYVPEGAEVQFRVWSAGERTHEMEEG